ncbi:MAG: hypothetical protein SFV54_20290 [Bryobacteraceae bacterium]|nr:hypothetical protein [Bryobacteraceae bacterium]
MLSVKSIAEDRAAGATELALRAAELLVHVAREGDWRATARALAHAQPAMAPILRIASEVEAAPDAASAASIAAAWQRRLARTSAEIARHAAALVNGPVLTHSYSAAVFQTLVEARRQGLTFDVIATESNPLGEGRRLVEDLAGQGIAARLIPDAAAGAALEQTAVVLIGADSVSPSGLVNKVGTSLIVAVARLRRKPAYALFGEEKVWPSPLPTGSLFDRTPLDWFSGFVTAAGTLPSLLSLFPSPVPSAHLRLLD